MSKKNRYKTRELKNKVEEKRRLEKLKSISPTSKIELRAVKLANRSPKGDKNIKNTSDYILEMNNVTKTYVTGSNKYVALKNVSLNIKKGEFIIILGESGSGKTSLLNVLSGLDRPTSGEIIINDINIAALNNKDLTTFRRNNIGFIFQSYNLLLELNAKDNAEMGRQLQTDNNKRLEIDDLFTKVGMNGHQKNPITNLSGGQLQRVSIIRALSKNPKIICADEPTGALDSKTSIKIIELFKSINKKYGTSIIFVTHNENYIKYADKIVRVTDGKVNVQT